MTVMDVVADETGWTVSLESMALAVYRMSADTDDGGRRWAMPDPARRPISGDVSAWDRAPEQFRQLAGAVTARTADAATAIEYGRHLFEALLAPAWSEIEAYHKADVPIVLGLRWDASDGALHRLVWELVHDGTGFLTLREHRPLVLVRLVRTEQPVEPTTIGDVPRVLFAVGSHLTDQRVRSGAEFMGVLRGLERNGGSVVQRVLTQASRSELADACARMQPDIVHLICHGRLDDEGRRGLVELRGETSGIEEAGAAVLQAAIGSPTLVVVSACQSGTTANDVGAPLAAELVADGIPLALAMGGDIADTPCRVFTRSVAAAIADGHPLTRALADGRRASFRHTATMPATVDWALPALFASVPVTDGFRLVDTTRSKAMRQRVIDLNLFRRPIFCGRDEFLAELDRLLSRDESLSVLVAMTSDESRLGGSRLLRELAAAAVRAGHLPILLGPFESAGEAPTTVAALALALASKIIELADMHGIDMPQRLLAAVAGTDADRAAATSKLLQMAREKPAEVDPRTLAVELRRDLAILRAGVAAAYPGLVAEDATTVVLFDDVHWYEDALDALIELLGSRGIGMAPEPLPVVLFGKQGEGDGARLADFQASAGGSGWASFRMLRHVIDLGEGLDRLAFLGWFLHPEPDIPDAPTRVLVPTRVKPGAADHSVWLDVLRALAEQAEPRLFYDPKQLKVIEGMALKHEWFTQADDDDILRQFGMQR
jgi:hypothetical protein